MIRYQNVRPVGADPAFLNGFTPFPELAFIEARPQMSRRIEAPRIKSASMARVFDAICEAFFVCPKDLKSDRRGRSISIPRQAAYLLAKQNTTLSFPQIGRYIGNRDHTTVMHGVKRASALFETDSEFRRKFSIATKLFKQARIA